MTVDDAKAKFETKHQLQKDALLHAKTNLGSDQLKSHFESYHDKANQKWKKFINDSKGKYVLATCEVYFKGISAEDFHEWYDKGIKTRFQPFQYATHPEHYGVEP